METLTEFGLANPRIEYLKIITKDGSRETEEFRLYCDNFSENNILSKKFSFFEQLFNNFLIENHAKLYEKLKFIVLPEEGIEKEDTVATEIILDFIKEEFCEYLQENKKHWQKEYFTKIKMTHFFKWFKAISPTSIIPTEEDTKNKCLFLCLIPKSLQNIIGRGSKEVETRIINILYKEKLFDLAPNIYYRYVDDVVIAKNDFHEEVKNHLKNDNVVIYIVPTNPSQKNKKQNVYLYKFLLKSKE